MSKKNPLDLVALILVIIGGLNWGLYGLFGLDLVRAVFGDMTILSKIIYILVGLSAVYMIFAAGKMKKSVSGPSSNVSA